MKYSVIVPQKNSLSFLNRLTKSIRNWQNYEILIIDDNSDKFVFEKMENEFGDNANIKILKSPGIGAGEARNYGIEMAMGEWILFADADDIFRTDAFKVLEKSCLSMYDLVYFFPLTKGMESNDYRIKYQKTFREYFRNPNTQNEWKIRLNFDVPWSKAVKKEFLIQNNIMFDNVKKQEDTLFAQQLGVFATNVRILPDSIYVAIDNPDSTSHKESMGLFDDIVDVRIRSYLFKKEHLTKEVLRKSDLYFFQTPIRYCWVSYSMFHDASYSLSVYKKFRDSKIPVFTFIALVRFIKQKYDLLV